MLTSSKKLALVALAALSLLAVRPSAFSTPAQAHPTSGQHQHGNEQGHSHDGR